MSQITKDQLEDMIKQYVKVGLLIGLNVEETALYKILLKEVEKCKDES